jgi:hypothetical protein
VRRAYAYAQEKRLCRGKRGREKEKRAKALEKEESEAIATLVTHVPRRQDMYELHEILIPLALAVALVLGGEWALNKWLDHHEQKKYDERESFTQMRRAFDSSPVPLERQTHYDFRPEHKRGPAPRFETDQELTQAMDDLTRKYHSRKPVNPDYGYWPDKEQP